MQTGHGPADTTEPPEGPAPERSSSTAGFPSTSMFSPSMQTELRRLERAALGTDALEVVAASLRLRERALLQLGIGDAVVNVAIRPQEGTFVADADWSREPSSRLSRARLLGFEPLAFDAPVPPGADTRPALPLSVLLWSLALHGPRSSLLSLIDQPCRFRVVALDGSTLQLAGALGSAVTRLRQAPASLDEIARWPGMTPERAARLVNALYLTSNLMVLRVRSGGGGWLQRKRARPSALGG